MFVGIAISLTANLLSSASPVALFASGEVGVWYDPSDLTTLFQDSAGTTPVTGPNQTVGLMLDKSQGLVLGSELVTNGDFSGGSTGWTITSGWTITGGQAVAASTSGSVYGGAVTSVSGRWYRVDFDVVSYTSGALRITVGGNFTTYAELTGAAMAAGRKSVLVLGGATTARGVEFYGGAVTATIDNISVKLLAGNHATQATSGQRPTYGVNPITGTRNLLTFTEQFDNAAWYKDAATISVNAITAPDGTLTADKLVENTANSPHDMYALPAAQPIATFTYSLYVKASGRTKFRLQQTNTTGYGVAFDLSALTATSILGGAVGVITGVGDGWYRCSMTYTTAASFSPTLALFLADASGSVSYTGDGTSGIYIWGAQFEQSATATAYQKVVSQYEVTQAGVQSASYIAFDGVDDGMVTGTITPGIDKAQVFAGVRKLSDAAFQTIAETSTIPDSSNGSVALGASTLTGDASRRTWSFSSAGSIFRISGAGVYAAPISSVLTGVGDIATDTSILRVNGTQVANNTGDQGTGNYLAYPLYLGRRGGTTQPYNGRIYSLIVRFGANLTTGQITSTESWVNSKTGAF
jgi:hypothetical protein